MKIKIQILLFFLCSGCLFIEEGEQQEIILEKIEQCILNGDSVLEKELNEYNNAIVALGPSYRNYGLCSGILIAKRLVLTAGHCGLDKNSVVRFGIDVRIPIEEIKAVQRIRHPNYPEPDLAVWILEKEPTTAKPYNYFGEANPEEQIILFGFGVGRQEPENKGLLRKINGFVDYKKNHFYYSYLCSGAISEGGDSGGPIFNSFGELISIHIGGIFTNKELTNDSFILSYSQNLNQFQDWIDLVLSYVICDIGIEKR